MDTTLSQLPFFQLLVLPEESTLSQLPFVSEQHVDDLRLPHRPPTVCQRCWEGPFVMHFGLPCVSPRDGQWYRHWPEQIRYSSSAAEMRSRADAGCIWCAFVYSKGWLMRASAFEWLITVRGTTKKWNDSDGDQYYQGITVNINGVELFEGYVYTVTDDPAAAYIRTQRALQDVGSPRSLALARLHIKECVKGHEHCKSLAPSSSLLPTHLVDCSDPDSPRLVSTSGKHGKYLALSYVWGGDQLYKTTKSTVTGYIEHGIDSAILPQTVRDAIGVTHALGYQFLWLDTLCIIQDDNVDRRHEIGQMHQIYRYAHLTIFTGSAASTSEGFLHAKRSESPKINKVVLPLICPPRTSTSAELPDARLVTQFQLGEVHIASTASARVWYSQQLGVMSTRTWCMQEYLMSLRALIFSPTRILFSCCTSVYGVGNTLDCMENEPRIPDTLFLQDLPEARPGSKEWKEMHAAWFKVAMDYSYSRRRATFASDKLVACAAVAQQFSRVLASQYLAGLWRSDTLLTDLLWRADREPGHRRLTAYCAPSWSWAGLEGAVFLDSRDSELLEDPRNVALARIIKCSVKLEDASLPFGQVKSGTLVLRGTLISCRGGSPQNAAKYWNIFTPSFENAQLQRWGLDDLDADERDEVGSVKPGDRAPVSLDCDADELPDKMSLVPFVRVSRWPFRLDHIYGIALEPVPSSESLASDRGSKKSLFRRVGKFSTYLEENSEHLLWDPLTWAIQDGDEDSRLWMDIMIV